MVVQGLDSMSLLHAILPSEVIRSMHYVKLLEQEENPCIEPAAEAPRENFLRLPLRRLPFRLRFFLVLNALGHLETAMKVNYCFRIEISSLD